MKVWIGEPGPQNTTWVFHPSTKSSKEQIDLIEAINHHGIDAFMVELYSVGDMHWVKNLHEAAKDLERFTGVKFHSNIHVHADRPDVIEFINNSPYLDYVPIVGI